LLTYHGASVIALSEHHFLNTVETHSIFYWFLGYCLTLFQLQSLQNRREDESDVTIWKEVVIAYF
jgi:hypothetical protein